MRFWASRSLPPLNEDDVGAFLEALEYHLTVGDEHVQDVIGTSFIENLIGEEAAVRWALGPRLTAELRRMEEWEPDAGGPPT